MAGLTEKTSTTIRELFPPEQHDTVAELLETECGNNLPFLEKADAQTLERFQLAALQLSKGTLAGLHAAVDLAKTDWRDLLMAASAEDEPRRRRKRRIWPK